jgi:putative transcriptional regulator
MLAKQFSARHLNVTSTNISQWDRGEKSPSGASLKLLNLVKRKGIEYIS